MLKEDKIDAVKMSNKICIICGEEAMNLSLYKDAKSWKTLYEAAQIRNHQRTLSAPVEGNGFPTQPIKYHRDYRSKFLSGLQKIMKKGHEA